MTARTRGLLLSGIGLSIAAGLGWTWWSAHGAVLKLGSDASPAVGACALICLVGAIGLQLVRTAWLLNCGVRALARPLLLAHGMNIWLPSVMGDLFEVWAVADVAGRTKRGTLVLLGHRFAGTLSALGILAAFALVSTQPSEAVAIGSGAVLAYLLVDKTVGRWSGWLRLPQDAQVPAPLGTRLTLGHLGLAVIQHSVEAIGIFLLAIAVGTPISPPVAAGMVSIIETLTYLPIPLGGAGANHWGASTVLSWMQAGGHTAILVATAHGVHVGLGALSIGCASALPRDGGTPNTA